MATVTIRSQTAVSVPLPQAGKLRLFFDSADSDILKSKDSLGVVRPSGVGTADELATTGSPVNVALAAPPTAGQILSAINPTQAGWIDTPPELTNTAVQSGPAPYAASVGDYVLVDVSVNPVTVTLPAGHVANDLIGVKMVSLATNSITIDPNGAETIDGAATLVLSTNGEWAVLRSNGTNWLQVE